MSSEDITREGLQKMKKELVAEWWELGTGKRYSTVGQELLTRIRIINSELKKKENK